MRPEQESKFAAVGDRLVNRATGEPIPDDEPVFILRAKDVHAVYTLMDYRSRCIGNPDHYQAIDARVGQFLKFRDEHPERMKQPDTDPECVYQSAHPTNCDGAK